MATDQIPNISNRHFHSPDARPDKPTGEARNLILRHRVQFRPDSSRKVSVLEKRGLKKQARGVNGVQGETQRCRDDHSSEKAMTKNYNA